jgi:tetratricopeptide (TPR) repeat protein
MSRNQTDLQAALNALGAGQAATALALASGRDPMDCGWLTVKALAHSLLRQPEPAAGLYQQLIGLEPGVAEHWMNLGNAQLELSHYSAAYQSLREAERLGMTDANLYFSISRAALESSEPMLAKSYVVRALQGGLEQDIEVGLHYLKCLIALDEIELAKDNAQRLMPAPMAPELACEFAFLVLQLSDYDATARAAAKVPKDSPEYPLALISLGLSFERSNKMAPLQHVRAELAALQPGFAVDAPTDRLMATIAGQSLAQLDARLAVRSKDFARADALLAAVLGAARLDANVRIALQFEHARVLDALNQTAAAFALLNQAHEARFAQVAAAHPSMAHEDDPLLLVSKAFSLPEPGFRCVDGMLDPVFVVGFPRSGTTLLEQLLDAHPALQSFDEQPFLQRCIGRMQQLGLSYPHALDQLSDEQIQILRTHYFSLCEAVMPHQTGSRYVDKNPLNLARLPLIQALFPQAQVITVLRHPADCVLSCYMQHFRAPAFAITMRTLVATATMYDRVFEFYQRARQRLQLPMHEIKYEDLVTDTAGSAERLFEFLQLSWDSTLLNFTERAKSRTISTPSYAAVTEPVNQHALWRWRRYQYQFESTGASALLARWQHEFGYQADKSSS